MCVIVIHANCASMQCPGFGTSNLRNHSSPDRLKRKIRPSEGGGLPITLLGCTLSTMPTKKGNIWAKPDGKPYSQTGSKKGETIEASEHRSDGSTQLAQSQRGCPQRRKGRPRRTRSGGDDNDRREGTRANGSERQGKDRQGEE